MSDQLWDDDPVLPEQGAAVGRKVSKKKRRLSEHFKGMAYEVTPAPRIQTAGQVIDAVVGNTVQGTGEMVSEALALEIIGDHGRGLQLGFREWAIVQDLVQRGVKRGVQIGRGQG